MSLPERAPTDWLKDPEQVKRFEQRMRAAGMSRRQFLAFAFAIGGAAALAACGGASPTATTTTSSSSAAAATSSASSSAASTTAAGGAATSSAASTSAASSASSSASSSAASGTPATGGSKVTLSNWPDSLPKPTDMATDQTFNTFLSEDPSSFDFNKDLYCGGSTYVVQGLFRYDPDFKLCPADATDYSLSADGTVYTFKLNPQAVWSNGDPITANDYIWSWTRQIDPATGASYAGFLLDIKNATSFNNKKGATAKDLGLKAVDDHTLEVTLEHPAGYFLILAAYTAAVPAHKPSVDKWGDKWTEPATTGAPIVSNAPFVVTKWDRGQLVTMERNEKYATGTKPYLKTIKSAIVAPSAGLAPYEGGDLDFRNFRGIPVGEIPRLQSDPNLKKQLVRHSQSGIFYLVPEVDHEPFTGDDGLKVRLAMQKAIDRTQLCKVIQNLGEPAFSLMSPDLPYYIDPAKYPDFKQAVDYNPDAAKKLLDGTKYASGKFPDKITMSLRDEGETTKTAAQFIQAQLKQNLGMNIELDIKPANTFNDPMFGRKYQLIFIRWYMDYPDPDDIYKLVFYSNKSSGKRQAWSDKPYDDLVVQAGAEADTTKRADLYRQAEKILQDQGVYVPLYYGYAYALFKPHVGGIPMTSAGVPQPDWNIFVDMDRSLYIKKS
jgi:oligopeptide transport system substrate-binding protein